MQENGSISFSNPDVLLEDIRPISIEFLEFFAEKKGLSAYDIYNNLKLLNKPVSYKNVNERVHKLAELKLIKIVEVQQENKRGTIPYELINEGIFHVLKNGPTPYLIFVGNKFIQNYRENDFFKNLLTPFINSKTIDKICTKTDIDFRKPDNIEGLLKSVEKDIKKVNADSIHVLLFFNLLFEYLRNCCLKIQETLKEILYKKSDLQYSHSIHYPNPPTYGNDFNELISFLKAEKIIDNIKLKDIKSKSFGIVVVKKENIEVTITEVMNKLTLTRKHEEKIKIFRYDVNRVNFNYKRLISFFRYEENELKNLGIKMTPFLEALVMNVILMISNSKIIDSKFRSNYEKNENEFISILINDEKFIENAKSLVNDLKDKFQMMMSIID